MENRYQLFLKKTLRAGVRELYADPSLAEVVGIPRPTFEVLVRAFRSGLPPDLLENLPVHDFSNEEYFRALLDRIDFLLSPGRIGEVEEITLSNMPSLVNLLPAYEETKSLQVAVSSYQKTWQAKFSQQIEKYNRDLIFGLQKQLEKDLPSLPPEKREILVRDLARTIQDQAFPAIELSWQTKDKLREATELTLKNYASEVEGLRKPELVSQIAQRVAEEQETAAWETRGAQISATTLPPTYEIDSSLRAAIIANLPAEVYQRNPKIAEQISQQVLGRLSLPSLAAQPTLEDYQKELANEIRVVIATPAIQKTIGSLSDFPSVIAYQIAPTAQAYSTSPQATAVGGTVGGAPPPVTPPVLGRPPAPLTAPKGGLEDIFFSQGSPGHILTSLASPRAGESFGRWAITGGLLRGPLGFALESIPGTPKLNYLLDLYGPYLGAIKVGFQKELLEAQGLHGYERARKRGEALTHLKIIHQFEKEIEQKPWLKIAYQGRVGLYRVIHPLRYLQMRLMGKSLALGIGTQSLMDILSAYTKYGGYGGAYVTEAVLKNLAVFALKVVGVKIGLYKVVGVYPYQKYVFKPTYGLKLKAQEFIYKGIGGLAKKLGGSALGKLVSFVVTSFLTGGGRVIFELLRRFWKWIAGGLGLLLLWLITKLGTIGGALAFLAGSVIGGAVGWFLGGPVGAVIGAIVGPIIAGGIVALLKNFLSPGAAVAGVGGGLGGGAGLAPSLAVYAKVAPIAMVGVAGVTILVNTITSSAFLVPAGEPSPVQSEYIEVAKSVGFSGNLGEPINYTLTITASRSRLVNVEIADTTSFTCTGTAPTVPVRNFIGQIPEEIIPGTPLILSYQVLTDQQFNDCLVDNTVQVTADVPDEQKTNEQSFTTGSVTIGNPPVVAPRGLPLKGNVCLSGYDFNELKRDGNLHQGIDIISDQLTVYSTFPQESRVVDVCGGAYCLGMPGGYSITLGLGLYSAYFAHLAEPPSFNLGDEVGPGASVGIMGDTGTSSFGAHVHYMIQESGKPVNPHNYGANPPNCP